VVMATAAGRVGPTRASAAVFLIPGVALFLGVVVRHESVALLSVLGCAVCVGGALLMRRAQSAPQTIRSADVRLEPVPCTTRTRA
jgi:drug/metabolite transporter (DMT)-like permease